MDCAAFVDIISIVDAVPDVVIHAEEGRETADQCQRDRTAVRAEARTVIVQSLLLIECSLHLCLSYVIHWTACRAGSC